MNTPTTRRSPLLSPPFDKLRTLLENNASLLVIVVCMLALPFIIAILDGQSIPSMLDSEPGNSKFLQGLLIEVFILAVFAISYDLVLGITGMLSLGHAFFFAFNAYLTGVMLKSFEWSLLPTLGLVVVASVLQALLFAIVLPRVGAGLTFALVTFGLAFFFILPVPETVPTVSYSGPSIPTF